MEPITLRTPESPVSWRVVGHTEVIETRLNGLVMVSRPGSSNSELAYRGMLARLRAVILRIAPNRPLNECISLESPIESVTAILCAVQSTVRRSRREEQATHLRRAQHLPLR